MEEPEKSRTERDLLSAGAAGTASIVLPFVTVVLFVLEAVVIALFFPETPRNPPDYPGIDLGREIAGAVAAWTVFAGFLISALLSGYAFLFATRSQNPARARAKAAGGLAAIGFIVMLALFLILSNGLSG